MSRRLFRLLLGTLVLALLVSGALAGRSPALAQSPIARTYVASFGSDVNDCSRATPCRTFGVALMHTTSSGEIVALDSAGYGAVTISQAVTIAAAPGVQASISPSSGNAIMVSAGASDKVVLRNLYLNGQGATNGVLLSSGAALFVENLVVNGFTAVGIWSSVGANPTELYITDTTVRNNGIGIQANSGGGVTAAVSVANARVENNGNGILAADGSKVAVRDSLANGNSVGFEAYSFVVSATALMSLEHCTASGNATAIFAAASNFGTSTVDVSETTIVYNATGLSTSGTAAAINSRSNNTLRLNTTNGTFTGTFTPQ